LYKQKVTNLYAQYRPTYPKEIFEKIVAEIPNMNSPTVVVDIGSGSGQATIKLVDYFDKVIGVEPSQAQIDSAPTHPKIQYICSGAESTTVPDNSANAIIVAQALHWFDLPIFWKEVDRILKDKGSGVFAAITYELNRFENDAANKVLDKVCFANFAFLLCDIFVTR